MKPTMIVHIGTPKTGTTTIQRALYEARLRMRKECNIHFGSTERGRTKGRTTSMARAALGSPEDVSKERAALLDDFERSQAGTLFLTDEILSAAKDCMADFFRPLANDFDITVICYLRRQDYFVESLYNQLIRKRRYRSVPAITEFARDATTMPRADYPQILSRWAEFAKHMVVRDFRKEVKDVGLLNSFQAAAGLTALGELTAKDENLSQDLRLLLTLCMLNAHVAHDEPRDETNDLSRGVFRAGRALADSGAFTPIKNTLGRIEREALLERYAESNERLYREYGIQFSNERPKEPQEAMLVPDGDFLLALMGELTAVEAIRFHRATQAYVMGMLGGVPAQSLVDPSLSARAPVEEMDFSLEEDDAFDQMPDFD